MGQKEMAVAGKNQIMIYGPKTDGTYIVECMGTKGQQPVPRSMSRASTPWKA
jgi:hypothetical protein